MAERIIDYGKLLDALNQCETKSDLVSALRSFGIKTTTKPTLTKGTDDLYFQLADKTRIQVRKTCLELWTSDEVSKQSKFSGKDFASVDDRNVRTKRLKVDKNADNLKFLLEDFLENVANWI